MLYTSGAYKHIYCPRVQFTRHRQLFPIQRVNGERKENRPKDLPSSVFLCTILIFCSQGESFCSIKMPSQFISLKTCHPLCNFLVVKRFSLPLYRKDFFVSTRRRESMSIESTDTPYHMDVYQSFLLMPFQLLSNDYFTHYDL